MAIRPALIPLLMCLLWSGTSAAAEDPLTDAKRAYEAAAYEDALRLLEAAPPGNAYGHCFPGGHASAGFCLFAFYFAGRALDSRRLMQVGLWGGLIAGMGFGLARVAQGAHFLSHNLWSAVLCWIAILGLYVAILGPVEAATAGARERPSSAAPG